LWQAWNFCRNTFTVKLDPNQAEAIEIPPQPKATTSPLKRSVLAHSSPVPGCVPNLWIVTLVVTRILLVGSESLPTVRTPGTVDVTYSFVQPTGENN
jgi:hypothetical protein